MFSQKQLLNPSPSKLLFPVAILTLCLTLSACENDQTPVAPVVKESKNSTSETDDTLLKSSIVPLASKPGITATSENNGVHKSAPNGAHENDRNLPLPLKHLISMATICKNANLNWSSIEAVESLEQGKVECFVRANARLSEFTPLILYGKGGIELRRVAQGREFYFSRDTSRKNVKTALPEKAIVIYQKIRKELATILPGASSQIINSTVRKKDSAIRISHNDQNALINFILKQDTHVYSASFTREANGEETMVVELEVLDLADTDKDL